MKFVATMGFALSLLLAAGVFAQQVGEEKPKEEAVAPAVEFDEKEIAKLAQILRKSRDKQLKATLRRIEKSDRNPLRALGSWEKVFSHEKFMKRGGRSGRHMKQVWVVNAGVAGTISNPYHLLVPSSYRAKTPMPLVLCLHPTQKKFRADAYFRQFYGSKELKDALIQLVPIAGEDEGFRWSERKKLYHSIGLLGRKISLDYNVDCNAVFLDGYADGGVEAWRVHGLFAHKFAGVIIRGAMPPPDTRFEDFKNSRVLLVGVPEMPLDPKKAEEVGAKLSAAGCDVTVVRLTAPVKARYERDAFESADAKLLEFLAKKRRDPYPKKLDWSVKNDFSGQHYWLTSKGEVEAEAVKSDAAKIPPHFVAHADRATNRITVKTHRITALAFELNDELVDLDKEVTITVNGKELFKGKAERSLELLLESYYGTGDWAQLYTWFHGLKVPQ